MRKILMIASDNNYASGAFRSMVKLCDIMKKSAKIEPVVVLPELGDGEILLSENNIPYFYIRSYTWVVPLNHTKSVVFYAKIYIKKILNYISIYRLYRYIKKNEIDIVHINTSYSYVGAIASKYAKCKCVWHIREMLEEDQNNTTWKQNREKIMAQVSCLIAISNFVYNKYKKDNNISNLVMIHNGIDEKEFFYQRDFSLNNYEKSIKIICVGGITEGKGQKDIIFASKELIDKGVSNFKVKFVGRGDKTEEYQQLVSRLNMSKNIEFVGAQKDVKKFYQEADVMIMSSKAEAFGRTTVEAMMSGCAVIATDAGANREILNDGQCGILYTQGNCEELAEKMKLLIDDRRLLCEVAEKGQKYAMKNFTAKKNAESIISVYQKLLEK